MLGEADVSVKGMLEEFGVYLKPAAFKQDVKPLLKDSCSAVFGSATGLTDMLVQHMPLSRVGTATKVSLRRVMQWVGICSIPWPFPCHTKQLAVPSLTGSSDDISVN